MWPLIGLLGIGAAYLYYRSTTPPATVTQGVPLGPSAINYIGQLASLDQAYNAAPTTPAQLMAQMQSIVAQAASDTSMSTTDQAALAAFVGVGAPMSASGVNYLGQLLSAYQTYSKATQGILTVIATAITGSSSAASAMSALQAQVAQIWAAAIADTTMAMTDFQMLEAVIQN